MEMRMPLPLGSTMRRGGGLRRMPDLLPALLDPVARRRGLAEARLLTDWATVVGPALAARCQPIRLAAGEGRGGVLHLHVTGTAALEIQHSAPQILERINGFFGRPVVGRLRLVQAPLPRPPAPPAPPPRPPLSAAEQAAIDGAVHAVEDRALRVALAALGETLRRDRRDRPAATAASAQVDGAG
jgi:hypothetical protein